MNVPAWALLACSVVLVLDAIRGGKNRTARKHMEAWSIIGLSALLTVLQFRDGQSLWQEAPWTHAAAVASGIAWIFLAVCWGRKRKPMRRALFYAGLIGSISWPVVVRHLLG